MEVHILDGQDFTHEWSAAYCDFVAGRPDANIYHTLEWHAVIQETYGYPPVYIILEQAGEVRGVLPLFAVRGLLGKRLVSIPFSPYVPVLATDYAALQKLLDAAERLCTERRYDYMVLRHGLELPRRDKWQRTEDNLISVLDLSRPVEEIWKGLDRYARKAVKRARRDSVQVDRSQSGSAYKTFYGLVVQTRRRQGMPVYPPQLFDAIWRHLGTKGLSQIMLAKLDDRAVAGIVVLTLNGTAIDGYNMSTSDRRDMLSHPMDLLVWEGVQHAYANGARCFDFGTTPSFHESLLRFKEKWGATSTPLPYYTYAPSGRGRAINRQGVTARVASTVLRILPDRAYIWASTQIMKQIG